MSNSVFIVEDEPVIAASIERRLEQIGYAIAGVASSGESAVRQSVASRPDLVLMDIRLEGSMDGIEAAEAIKKRLDIPVVFLTAFADESTIQRARKQQPFGYIVKPFTDRELAGAIEIALERAELEKHLRVSEERHRMLSEVVTDYAFCVRLARDKQDDALTWELGSAPRVFGAEINPFSSISDIGHLLHPDDSGRVHAFWTAVRAGESGRIEFRVVGRDGEERWLKLDAKIGKTRESEDVIYGAFQDITTLRRTELQLQEAQFEFSQIVQQVRQGIWVSDSEGICIYANQALCDLTGYTAEEIVGHLSLTDLIAQTDADQDETEFETVLSSKSGSDVPVLITPRHISGERGAERGSFFLIVDLSRQKRAQALLERGARKLQGVFHASPVPSLLIDAGTNAIVDVNRAFSAATGFSAEEIVGTGGFALADFENLGELNLMISLLKERNTSRREVRLKTRAGASALFAIEVREIIVEDEELLMLLLHTVEPGERHSRQRG